MRAVINTEEFIGKTVGRRRGAPKIPDYAFDLQKAMGRISFSRFPKGVFRFNSHEEADQWLMDHLTRKPAN